MSAVVDFRKAVTLELRQKGVAVRRWPNATRVSDHVLELETAPKRTVLYVKESNLSRALFWGLTKNQLERMRSGQVRWFVILLANGSNAGYALSGGQVDAQIHRGAFELSADGDYKVNEQADLSAAQRFPSIASLLHRIL